MVSLQYFTSLGNPEGEKGLTRLIKAQTSPEAVEKREAIKKIIPGYSKSDSREYNPLLIV